MFCIDLLSRGRRRGVWPFAAPAGIALVLAGCGSAPSTGDSATGAVRRPVPLSSLPVTAPPTPQWSSYRVQVAQRIVDANPEITYSGPSPDPLLAIPVLVIELNGDGSVHRIDVLREPRQAPETTSIAIKAVRRAAPFGDVSRLPKPWRFTETFLFDDDRRFKPRSLD